MDVLVHDLDPPLDFTHFICLLFQSLLRILETPKGHAAFRVSSGFNGLLSLLSDLEGSLQVPVVSTWGSVSHSQTLELVLHTLCVVSAALHLDPVNGHFFRTNGLFEKLAEDLCLLGCFGAAEEEGAQRLSSSDVKARPFVDLLSSAFSSSCPFPPRLQNCLQILSFLDSMASGTLHLRRDLMEPARAGQEPSADAQKGDASGHQGKLKQWPDLEERLALSWLLLLWVTSVSGAHSFLIQLSLWVQWEGRSSYRLGVLESCQTFKYRRGLQAPYSGSS